MKINFKKIIIGIFGIILILSLIIPLNLFAEESSRRQNPNTIRQDFRRENREQERTQREERKREVEDEKELLDQRKQTPVRMGFCVKINNLSDRAEKELTDRMIRLQESQQNRSDKFIQQREERNARRIIRREQNLLGRFEDKDYDEFEEYERFKERTLTDAQSQAIDTFKKAVETAVNNRKLATDNAIRTFRQGLNQILESRRLALESARNNLNNARLAIIERAKTDCNQGVAPDTIHQQFRISMQTAQEQFRNNRQTVAQLQTQIAPLRLVKQQAIEKARTDFNAAIEKARTDLRAAF